MSEGLQVDARQLDDQAYGLMQAALARIPQGEWKAAADALEQAACLHGRAGRSYDEARCLQLAATLQRSAGESELAGALSQKAAAIAPSDLPLQVSIAAEQAETAFAGGDCEAAVEAWTDAIGKAQKAGLKAEGLSAFLRRRAAASIALGRIKPAMDDFDQAYQLLDAEFSHSVAAFVRIEQANVLWEYGHRDESERVVSQLERGLVDKPENPHLLAELLVLRARLALAGGSPDNAVDYARRARNAALQAVAPVSYFAASASLAEALQAQSDYASAYGALATAWATLSDVVGDDVASSWVEPCLLGYKLRWGEPAFQEAKSGYEALRRAEMRRND